MAYNYEYPYTDPNRYNADWLLHEMKRVLEDILSTKQDILSTKQDFKELKSHVENYLKNLVVSTELRAIINNMISDGTFDTILANVLNLYARSVNVKFFGAKGDGVSDDTEAIDKALEYAVNNNIHTIYFPDGTYYLPNRRYTIDTSRQSWVGENVTKLRSSGLESGAFITLTSPLSLEMYDYARVPLSNICIEGTYNDDTENMGVNGISFGDVDSPATTMVSPHLALYNVTVKNFNVGVYLASAYKSSAYNLNIIACNYGLYIGDGGIVPWNCYCCHIECCFIAVYSLADGYAEARFFGGAFEYNRIAFTGYGRHTFVGVRFEFDFLAACNSELETQSVFNLSSPSTGYIKFTDCSFLLLPNFAQNASHWIQNPYKATVNNNPVIFAYSGSYYGKCQIMMDNCEIATDGDTQYPTGSYIISAQKAMSHHNVYYGGGNVINPAILVTETNGFIDG